MEGDLLTGMFDGGWWTILVGFIITPALVAASKMLNEFVSRWFAARHLRADPLYDPGSVLRRICEGDQVVYGRCVVHSVQTGRIEVRGMTVDGALDGSAMSWTIREFVERFDPVAEVGPYPPCARTKSGSCRKETRRYERQYNYRSGLLYLGNRFDCLRSLIRLRQCGTSLATTSLA